MIRKLIIGNGRSEREILLVGNITIGRDPACHVSEPDPLLSRRHAEIIANVHGVSVRDLNSRNGILVNGEKTREQVLLPGDVVQLGHLQLRYVEENARTADGHGKPRHGRTPAGAGAARAVALRYRSLQARSAHAPGFPADTATQYAGGRNRRRCQVAAPRRRHHRRRPRRTRQGFRAVEPHSTKPSRFRSRAVDRRASIRRWPRRVRRAVAPRHDARAHAGRYGRDDLGAAPRATLTGRQSLDRPGRHDAGDDGSGLSPDATMTPGNATFASALEHLAGIANPGNEQVRPGPGARLVANAELTVTDATPACAELLGVPGDELIGDSLTDVFLRGVRRAYAEPGHGPVTHAWRADARGSITVTFTLDKTGGTE